MTDPTVTPGLDGAPIAWPAGTIWPLAPDGSIPVVQAPLADFGPTIASVEVDAAVIENLKEWMDTYLRFIEDSRRLDYKLARPVPGAYKNVIDPDQIADYPLPGIFVATSKTESQPLVNSDGGYETPWLVAISAVCRGRTPAETRTNASYYDLAIRMAMVQGLKGKPLGRDFSPPVDVNAVGCRWLAGGEARPVADPRGRGRWLGEGASEFVVYTDAAVSEGIGPALPDQPVYTDLPEVEDITIEVDGVPIPDGSENS